MRSHGLICFIPCMIEPPAPKDSDKDNTRSISSVKKDAQKDKVYIYTCHEKNRRHIQLTHSTGIGDSRKYDTTRIRHKP